VSTTATAPLPPAEDDDIEHIALDEDYVLTPGFVEKVVDAADDGDGVKLRSLLEDLHPADVADLMGFLTEQHRGVVVVWLPPELLADTLPELDDSIREEVLERVPHLTLAEALQELDSDDAAAVVEDLEDDQREKVLAAMPEVDRAAIESSLGYAEDSAGRMMQREVMAAPQFWTVGDTIDHIRKQGEELPELFFDIYVVDPLNRPVGGVPVSQLLRSSRKVRDADRDHGADQRDHRRSGPGRGRLHLREIPPDLGPGDRFRRPAGGPDHRR
jgi:magnesium transporter